MDSKVLTPMKPLTAVLFGCVVLASYAAPNPEAAFQDLNQTIAGRVPDAVVWRTGGPEDAAVDKRVAAFLAEPLSAQSAVQVALLSNRGLQARYAVRGIAGASRIARESCLRNHGQAVDGPWHQH